MSSTVSAAYGPWDENITMNETHSLYENYVYLRSGRRLNVPVQRILKGLYHTGPRTLGPFHIARAIARLRKARHTRLRVHEDESSLSKCL